MINFSVYYSEYSVTISPEFEVNQRDVVSEPGILSSAGPPRTGTPAVPNMVITHDASQDEREEQDKPDGSSGGPSLDAENSSTMISKASRRSIVSVAFATCNESGEKQREHDG